MEKKTTNFWLSSYLNYLRQEEKCEATQKQYQREIIRFLSFMKNKEWKKETVICYKKELEEKYSPVSVNTKLTAVNGFLMFVGKENMKVKLLKIQRKTYLSPKKELTKAEYLRLVKAAQKRKDHRLSLLIQTICNTGIRVSELRFITAEGVEQGEINIHLKGKNRVILISGKIRKRLKKYLQQEKITTGCVFVTKNGKPLDRSNIWKMMKSLCKETGIEKSKVFPHNLRHLFARTFYMMCKDITKLADVLGHSNINTTRIYTMSSGKEHRQYIDAMGLIL